MHLLDRDIANCRALVVDANATSRSIIVSQLRDFGVGTVVQCSRLGDARIQLEARRFDVVLCEHDFHGSADSGQQLLDDLRRQQLLPLSTVFVMITGEASYAKVAEAAESALDSYLIKPHTAAALGDRLVQARRRKTVLKEIFAAIDGADFETAARLCSERFAQRGEYWLFAARVGAELLLTLGRPADARAAYESVLAVRAAPWARLGVARALADANEPVRATRALQTLIDEQPGYTDAWDVMARVQLEQGHLGPALDAARQAVAQTPGSVVRLQKAGMLAWYGGEHDEAARALERANAIGNGSKMLDEQCTVLLAFARFRQGDLKALLRCGDALQRALARAPDSARLQRFDQAARVLALVLDRQPAPALAELASLWAQSRAPDFDVEAACNALQMLALLAAGARLIPDDANACIDAIGLRHCASKMLTELLLRSAAAHPPFVERIKACHARVLQTAERALAHSLAGHHAAAARGLLDQARLTLNAKLLDTARGVLQRHQARIDGVEAIAAELEALRRSHCAERGRPPMGDGARKAGGLVLRSTAPAAPVAA